ncbi:MAG: hypothetical protein CVU72_07555, partial [Deltaproteobacteria bacterium HGW-Deltaproteobacteria-7]
MELNGTAGEPETHREKTIEVADNDHNGYLCFINKARIMTDSDLAAKRSRLMSRRKFCGILAGSLISTGFLPPILQARIMETTPKEDIFAFMDRTVGRFDRTT